MSPAHGGTQDGELAHERPERRGAGDREQAHQQEQARRREAAQQPAERRGGGGSGGEHHVPHGQEEEPLHQRVVDQVEHAAVRSDAAEAEAEDQQAGVLHAGIGQQALDVGLPDDESGRDCERAQPEGDQRRLHEGALTRRHGDLGRARQTQERAARQAAGHEGAHERRRLAVRVRLPGVHGREAELRAIPGQEEHERGLEPRRVEPGCPGDEILQHQRAGGGAGIRLGRRQEERAEQRQRDPDRRENEILPHRFQRSPVMAMKNQRRERQRGRLHPHPEEREMMTYRDERGAGQEREQAARERPSTARVLVAQISHRGHGDDREQPAHRREHDEPQRIERQPTVEHGCRRVDPRIGHQHDVQGGHPDEPRRTVGDRSPGPPSKRVRAERAQGGKQYQREQHRHSFSAVRRAESSESNSRLM